MNMSNWEVVNIENGTWKLGDVRNLNGREIMIMIYEKSIFVAKCQIEGHLLCKKDFESEPGDIEIIAFDEYIEHQFDEWAQEEIYRSSQE